MAGGDPDLSKVLMDTSKTLTGGDLWSYLTSKEQRIKLTNCLTGLAAIKLPLRRQPFLNFQKEKSA
jgi:NADPH2:quinone reductase